MKAVASRPSGRRSIDVAFLVMAWRSADAMQRTGSRRPRARTVRRRSPDSCVGTGPGGAGPNRGHARAGRAHAGAPGRVVPAALKQPLFVQDRVRTQATSRAAILFVDETQVRLNAGAVLTVQEVKRGTGNPTVLDLTKGEGWFRTKNPASGLTVKTPAASAAIRGTEINVSVEPGRGDGVDRRRGRGGVLQRVRPRDGDGGRTGGRPAGPGAGQADRAEPGGRGAVGALLPGGLAVERVACGRARGRGPRRVREAPGQRPGGSVELPCKACRQATRGSRSARRRP